MPLQLQWDSAPTPAATTGEARFRFLRECELGSHSFLMRNIATQSYHFSIYKSRQNHRKFIIKPTGFYARKIEFLKLAKKFVRVCRILPVAVEYYYEGAWAVPNWN